LSNKLMLKFPFLILLKFMHRQLWILLCDKLPELKMKLSLLSVLLPFNI
jgi:hypothetical protein